MLQALPRCRRLEICNRRNKRGAQDFTVAYGTEDSILGAADAFSCTEVVQCDMKKILFSAKMRPSVQSKAYVALAKKHTKAMLASIRHAQTMIKLP